MNLIADGHRVAVLAVDPSSGRTGGSILGDKTRMARLADDDTRSSGRRPSAGTLGGVAKATRETMLVMEAAGYDVVLVETVGVGQSEYVVADMVDTFLFLTLARTGDQLQGMKRGILELADVIAVNKADEDARDATRSTRPASCPAALRFLRGPDDEWQTPVVTCSGLHNINLDQVWQHVVRHRAWLDAHGGLARKRREQLVEWTRALVRDRLLARLPTAGGPRRRCARAEDAVRAGELTPDQAARQILAALDADRASRWSSPCRGRGAGRRVARRDAAEPRAPPAALPAELLGDFLPALADGGGRRRAVPGAAAAPYRALGERAAGRGVALRALLDLTCPRRWRLWPSPARRCAEPRERPRRGRAPARSMLRAADDVVAALTEGFQLARRSLVRAQESARREFIDDLLGGAADVAGLAAPRGRLRPGPRRPARRGRGRRRARLRRRRAR